ncbi:hypothetical protein DFH06DRAFT_1308262 [Mycena polygramma]|nr:hypothetical protein DFH06DRAFT_1110727 [Mycena polygramma]KAJ7611940.1 hypothetical protein DFH06DRAFT_1308262 [Mycena polygramma]
MSLPTASVDPQAIIETFALAIRPAIAFILITTILGTILVPLLFLLFALSSPGSRRKPIFILNVIAVSLGLITTGVSLHFQIHSIFAPFSTINVVENLIYVYLDVWLPWFSEAVLLLRVAIVFPQHRLLALLAFPIVIKAGRVATNILYCVTWTRLLLNGAGSQYSVLAEFPKPIFKAAFFLELADNSYVSFLFLWRLGWHRKSQSLFGSSRTERVTWSHSKGTPSYSEKLQTLFWIASTNFVFPLIFLLVEIIMIFAGTETVIYAGVDNVRTYVTIIATTFATVWSSTTSFKEAIAQDQHQANPPKSMVFRMGATMPTTASDEESVLPVRTERSGENVKPESNW